MFIIDSYYVFFFYNLVRQIFLLLDCMLSMCGCGNRWDLHRPIDEPLGCIIQVRWCSERETILTFIAFTLCLTSLFLLHYEVMAVATNKYYFSLFGHLKKNNVFKNTIFELVFV